MDYEKKYKKALEKARQLCDYPTTQPFISDLQDLFPELQESEDEKIRKALIGLVQEFYEQTSAFYKEVSVKDILIWLEKQGENNMGISEATKQKLEDNLKKALEKETPESWNEFLDGEQKHIINVPPREVILSIWDLGNEWKELTHGSISTEYGTQLEYIQNHWKESEYYLKKQGEQKFEQKFFINDKVVHKVTGKIWTIHHYLKDTNSYYVEDNDGLLHHYRESELKLVEQKPAWSEEDEKKLLCICAWIKDYPRIADFKDEMYTVANNYIDWLKSLRPQNRWKPSKEQLHYLSWIANIKLGDNVVEQEVSKHLNELLEDLKKL